MSARKEMLSMLKAIRRVVTGHNAAGKSVIVSDDASPHKLVLCDEPAIGLTNLWITDGTPADNKNGSDGAARKVELKPPANGSIFRVVEFPPDIQMAGKLDRAKVFAAMSAPDTMDSDTSRHPMMHKTSTVDYAIIMSGEIYAVMDEGETLLRAGDCLVQRGTNHAWSNRSDKPCLVAFVLIDASPIKS
jgi:hypothetical protein